MAARVPNEIRRIVSVSAQKISGGAGTQTLSVSGTKTTRGHLVGGQTFAGRHIDL